MKTIRIGCRAACAIIVFALVAQAAAAVDLESLGLTVVSTQKIEDQTVWELQTAGGDRVTVLADGELTDERAARAAHLYQTIAGWQWMDAASLRVTLTGRRAQALVVPTRYTYDGLDLIRFLPSGMQFYLDTILEYDFRMKVGTLFLRMKGQFFDAAELSARVAGAARDPVKFLERTDPEYLFRTLQETTSAIQQLESGGANAVENLMDLVAGYKLLKEERPLLEAKIAELTTALAGGQAAMQALQTQVAALQTQGAALQTQGAALQTQVAALQPSLDAAVADWTARQGEMAAGMDAAIETTRAGVLAAGNAGLFSGPRAMDRAMVARVVELKRGNTALATADILTTLKAEGIAATKRQVDLINLVYFGPAN